MDTSGNVADATAGIGCGARLSQANERRRERLMAWYAPARFGIFYHYGLFTGGGCATSGDKYSSPLAHPTPDAFEAAAPDPRVVARNLASAARDCGARYATLTVFHSCGGQTVLYPTKRPEFFHSTRRDYIRPFLEECRAAGVMPVLYIPCDCHNWDNPQTGPNMPEEIGRDTALYAKAFEAIIGEIHERYGDLPAGFWLDGGVPKTCFGAAALLHRLWPDAVVIGNNADAFDCPDVDCGTTECLDGSVRLDPPYDRQGGYLKLNAWGCTLPRTDFNEDIPTPNGWWFQGDGSPIGGEYAADRFCLLRQLLCAIGRRGQWNFNPGIGPRIDGTIPPNVAPQLAAIRDFLSWAGEAVYGTTGPEGSFVHSGWVNVQGSLSFCAVTRRLDAPSVFYAIFTEAPSQGLAMLDTMGREPRRATDLRTGRELPFDMWAGPVFKDGPWGDVAECGAAVIRLEF